MTTPAKKHPCADCRHCQWCSDDRCRLCRLSPPGAPRKLTFAEQIDHFEQLNRAACRLPAPLPPGEKP